MILIGGLGSPFVRRVAITLRLYDIAFEHRPLSAAKPEERVQLQAINPLVRVPALVTEDVGVLVDSATILDYLDRLVEPEKALLPATGRERTQILALIGIVTGAAEKAVSAYYETGKRPAEKVHKPVLDQYLEQSAAGFRAIEHEARAPWLMGQTMTQADVTTVACWDFAVRVRAVDAPALDCPKLAALSVHANKLPAFAETLPAR
ncbi:MAG: glutathione S-transferase [Gammaproteobacteria bacterium]|jgi:glutathione S-transferase